MNMLNSALVKGKTSNPIIYIKNQFIDSICKLSIGERRIIWFWLEAYKFDSVHTLTRDVIIDHGEYARTFQLTASHAAKEIRTALSAFPDNTVYEARPEWIDNVISCLDEKILSEDDLLSLAPFQKRNITDTCSFGFERGKSKVTFTNGFIDLIRPVKNDPFTQYRLLYVNTLNNNAAALYEQIKRWVSKGKYTTTPIALINKLSLSDSYLSFPQMRRGYLAPTISSINKRTDLSVYIQEIRRNPANKNSKVVKLIFWIKRKNENKLISKESDL